MSTVLFLNTDKEISKNTMKQIKSVCKQKIADMAFVSYGKYNGVIGESYFVDSMWTPFRFQLQAFAGAEKYSEFVRVFETVKEIIKLLLDNNYSLSLFLNSVGEDKKEFVEMKILSLSDLNENLRLEYAKIYKISK